MTTDQEKCREALLPCPFCGGEAKLFRTKDEDMWSHDTVNWIQVGCSECECATHSWPEHDVGENNPVIQWNTRAAPVAGSGEALPDWEHPDVQTVYKLLCADIEPPGNDHWEGFVARRIVAALNPSSESPTTHQKTIDAPVVGSGKAVAWAIYLHGLTDVFLNKGDCELEAKRRDRLYPDSNRKVRPLVFGDVPHTTHQKAIDAMRGAVGAINYLIENIEPPPDRECRCHLAPPCNDCVEHGGMREALSDAYKSITQLTESLKAMGVEL